MRAIATAPFATDSSFHLIPTSWSCSLGALRSSGLHGGLLVFFFFPSYVAGLTASQVDHGVRAIPRLLGGHDGPVAIW
jgi:hypothetical protein